MSKLQTEDVCSALPGHVRQPKFPGYSINNSIPMRSAGAAGVGLLALAPPAEAKIIYTPAHRVITPKHSYNIDFNHKGITDFKITNSVSACTDFCFFELR